MNYRKLLILAVFGSQAVFGMQKQAQTINLKDQALTWICEHKTAVFAGGCTLFAGYGLYRYFSKPQALEKRIKNNKKDLEIALSQKFEAIINDAPFMDFHAGIRSLTLSKNNGYNAGYVLVKNPETQQYKFLVVFQDKTDKKNLISYRYSGKNLEQASPQEISYLQHEGYLAPQGLAIAS